MLRQLSILAALGLGLALIARPSTLSAAPAAALPAAETTPTPAAGEPAQSHHGHAGPSGAGAITEGNPTSTLGMDAPAEPKTPARLELERRFEERYRAAGPATRAVFDEFLPALGAPGILDVLEAVHPLCHNEAHELGRALYAQTPELDAAVAACGARCTSGCTHGVLKEAFGTVDLATLRPRLGTLCAQGALADAVRIGTCAHGMGHALMMITGNDVAESVSACGAFGTRVLADFCASGVFMEYFEHPAPPAGAGPLYPCDTLTAHPAACFRYLTLTLMRRPSMGGDGGVLALCRSLPRPQRLGCIHGFGFGLVPRLARDPKAIRACLGTDADERTMCIEGAMEIFGGMAPELARPVCAMLTGDDAEVCTAAAESGLYRLEKPSMPLYFGDAPP